MLEVAKVAWPPLRLAVPSILPLLLVSSKVTMPLALMGVTSAVKVTAWPKMVEFAVALMVVLVDDSIIAP